MQISTDGFLTFEDPRVFSLETISIIAPFFADIDTRGLGNVYYR